MSNFGLKVLAICFGCAAWLIVRLRGPTAFVQKLTGVSVAMLAIPLNLVSILVVMQFYSFSLFGMLCLGLVYIHDIPATLHLWQREAADGSLIPWEYFAACAGRVMLVGISIGMLPLSLCAGDADWFFLPPGFALAATSWAIAC